jgi:hypothetical protein
MRGGEKKTECGYKEHGPGGANRRADGEIAERPLPMRDGKRKSPWAEQSQHVTYRETLRQWFAEKRYPPT